MKIWKYAFVKIWNINLYKYRNIQMYMYKKIGLKNICKEDKFIYKNYKHAIEAHLQWENGRPVSITLSYQT